MRNQQQMMDLIMQFAEQDERVRVVAMNGSRVNTKVPFDIFQDYDIVYLVTDVKSFIEDCDWTDYFGEKIIMQMPDAMGDSLEDNDGRFAYLMLLADGNRIDLRLFPLSLQATYIHEDKLIQVLLDKDQRMPELLPPTDEDYHITSPTAQQYANCCNEFWWVSTYAAKGLWRQEMIYVLDHLHLYIRPMVLQMLTWQVGIDTAFKVSIGKNHKYLQSFLEPSVWTQLLATYPTADEEKIWQALDVMMDLFRQTACDVAKQMNFEYDTVQDQKVRTYMHHIRYLSPEAQDFDL